MCVHLGLCLWPVPGGGSPFLGHSMSRTRATKGAKSEEGMRARFLRLLLYTKGPETIVLGPTKVRKVLHC